MLIIGEISGIQDFVFSVRESGGGQAASLRFRSFRLQAIAECLARKFLWACGLDESRLLFVAAGKFAIDAGGVATVADAMASASDEAQQWLLENAHGRLRLAVAAEAGGATIVERYHFTMAALQRSKLRAWRGAGAHAGGWTAGALSTRSPWDGEGEAARDAGEGPLLSRAGILSLAPVPAPARGDPRAIVGIMPSWHAAADPPSGDPVEIDLRRLARHVPLDRDGRPTEFIPLAGRSRGVAMLGVLKADVDSLGAVIRSRLSNSTDFRPLKQLSAAMEIFSDANSSTG